MEDNIQTIDDKECTPLVRWDDSAWENPFEDSLEQGKREGREMGSAAGYEEGRQIGRALATEIGMEVGFISGCCEEILENLSSLLGEENTVKKEKVISNIEVVKKLIHENFGTTSSKDPTLLLHNYSYPHPDVQQCSSTSITSMDEPIRTSDTASKFLATRNEKVSSIFSDDLDVPKVLQNIRTRVSCSCIIHCFLYPPHSFY